MTMGKKDSKQISELRDTLRNNYRTPAALNQMLGKYLRASSKRRGSFPTYFCNQHGDKTPSVTVNPTGKICCGCFPCGIVCNNPIDVAMEFGNLDFEPAVLEAAVEFGLISSSEADDIMEGTTYHKPIKKPKNVVKPIITTYDRKEYDINKANLIYRIFSNLNHMSGKQRLKEEHLLELREKRRLSDEEIKEIGFFSFPTADINLLIETMKKYNLTAEDLALIPGFYYDIKTKKWDYCKIKGEAYCIPIRNKDKKIVAIQIRLTDKEATSRYIWFASTFAMYNDNEKEKTGRKGNSPGTPFNICYPKEIKNKSLFITEGFYKAYEYARTFGGIAISVQGVNNVEGIEDVVAAITKENNIKNIIIGFDADMSIKDTVLKPALKLGAKLLDMDEETFAKMELILASGQKEEKNLSKNYKKEAKEIGAFFKLCSKYYVFYATWDLKYEKGFDDLIHAGNQNQIRSIRIDSFWRKAFRILQEIDNYKFEESTAKCVKFTEIKLPDHLAQNMFNNLMIS